MMWHYIQLLGIFQNIKYDLAANLHIQIWPTWYLEMFEIGFSVMVAMPACM